MKFVKIIGVLFIIFLLSGCSKRLGYIDTNKITKQEHIVLKSYELNKKQSSYVGSSMIKVNDYNKIIRSTDKMKPTKDFIFNTNGSTKYSFTKDDLFSIKGLWEINGAKYTAVNHDKLRSIHLLIRDDGSIHYKVANMIPSSISTGEAVTMIYDFEHLPNTVRMITVKNTENKIIKGQINYELIYTGKNKDSFMLTYREYTNDDLARPSFFQNLTYDKNMDKIRFRNLLIKIYSIDNEKIVFAVLNDKLK